MTTLDLSKLLTIMSRSSNYVPEHLREGLALYMMGGILPGDFLTAVLENDLTRAMAFGDDSSLAGLHSLVCFLMNECPTAAWGSVDTVRAWVSMPPEGRQAIAASRGWA